MSTVAEIERAFALYLKQAVPARDIVRAKAGESPAPHRDAVLWDLATVTPSDNPVTTYEDDDQVITSTDTMLEFTVTLLGLATMQDAMTICNGLRATQRTADLYRVCGLWGTTAPQDLSALETGTIRSRAQFTVTFSAPIETVLARETIDTQDVTIREPDRQIDVTITIEAP